MSDLLKNVRFIGEDDGASATPAPTQPPVKEDDLVLRRAGDPVVPKRAEPSPAPVRTVLAPPDSDAPGSIPSWIGWAFAGVTLLCIALVALGLFAGGSVTPWTWAALAAAVVVPAGLAVAAVAALRTLRDVSAEASRIARIGDRLTRIDASVESDVATVASAIRNEIAAVDARLAGARDRLEGFGAALSQQSRTFDGTTKSVAERSETIGRALTLHRQAFESLSTTFDAEMEKLASRIESQREALAAVTAAAAADLEASRDAVNSTGQSLRETVEAASGSSRAADATLDAARERLEAVVARVQDSAAELDAVYERRADHLHSLTQRLAGEKDGTQAALFAQTERLAAVDAQIEITEGRLTALVDHARTVHEGLLAQLSAIDTTLNGADTRSRQFTQALGDRVTDAVADARRDLSLMEQDLRALQSRLDGAATASLDLPQDPQPARPSGRVTLKPLDTDFPSLEPPKQAPRPPREPDTLELETLDEIVAIPPEPVDDPAPPPAAPVADVARDVVTRPGEDASASRRSPFGRAKPGDKAGWRWRDMLGAIDPLDAPEDAARPAVVRPPAGVPLAPPPAAPRLPDGSDVVARLCEVELAPSAVVDDETLHVAANAFAAGGTDAVSEAVVERKRDAVVHLRGVLAADLEFKLRAQAFARSMHAQLSQAGSPGEANAVLGSASGRAYLLCAAALRH